MLRCLLVLPLPLLLLSLPLLQSPAFLILCQLSLQIMFPGFLLSAEVLLQSRMSEPHPTLYLLMVFSVVPDIPRAEPHVSVAIGSAACVPADVGSDRRPQTIFISVVPTY